MIQVNLFDYEFAHTKALLGYDCAAHGIKPKEIEWIRNQANWDGVTVVTDRALLQIEPHNFKSKYKVAWLIEPASVHPQVYQQFDNYKNYYDYILTYNKNILDNNSKAIFQPIGSTRIELEDRGPCLKNRMCSIIASNATSAVGHKLRHEIVQRYSTKIDIYGSGYKWIDNKANALKPYMFSIAVLKEDTDYFFTEVLLDLFMTYTIPIFWGCNGIKKFFNQDGILVFKNIDELDGILNSLSIELYNSMLPAVKENYNLVQDYQSTDDMVAKNLKELFYV